MTIGSGRVTGSREPSPSCTGLGLSGFDPARIREVFPINGYAPGDYMGSCHNCKKQFIGAKRSLQCFDCAVVSLKAAFTGIDRLLRIKLWNEAKARGKSDHAAMQYINEEREKAIAMEARQGGDARLHPKDDSAGRQASPGTGEGTDQI